jgi:hypothetical protein
LCKNISKINVPFTSKFIIMCLLDNLADIADCGGLHTWQDMNSIVNGRFNCIATGIVRKKCYFIANVINKDSGNGMQALRKHKYLISRISDK